MAADAAAAVAAAAAPGPSGQDDRLAWVVDMRRRFSPAVAVCDGGSINQEFFKPKTVLIINEKKWGEAERELLLTGLEQHGVGKWRDIGEALLPGWDDHAIRVKASRLLCCQNLSRYVGRRFMPAEVQAEAERNRAIGVETGCWKGGMLVDDAAGTLKQYFAAQQQQQQQQGEGAS